MSRLRYNHAFSIAFEVLSNREDAKDVTPSRLRRALRKRLRELDDAEIFLACERFDTMRRED